MGEIPGDIGRAGTVFLFKIRENENVGKCSPSPWKSTSIDYYLINI